MCMFQYVRQNYAIMRPITGGSNLSFFRNYHLVIELPYHMSIWYNIFHLKSFEYLKSTVNRYIESY